MAPAQEVTILGVAVGAAAALLACARCSRSRSCSAVGGAAASARPPRARRPPVLALPAWNRGFARAGRRAAARRRPADFRDE